MKEKTKQWKKIFFPTYLPIQNIQDRGTANKHIFKDGLGWNIWKKSVINKYFIYSSFEENYTTLSGEFGYFWTFFSLPAFATAFLHVQNASAWTQKKTQACLHTKTKIMQ